METRDSMNIAMFKRLLAILFVGFLCAQQTQAQEISLNLGGTRQSVLVTLLPVYQSYEENDLSISQTSNVLSVVAPIGSNLSVSFLGSQMSTSGDVPDVNGLSDAQIFLSYAASAGSGSLILSLGTNLPVGKTELTSEEFASTILISQRAFDYRVPNLGQGLGVSPSVTYALPIGANTAFGAGVSYQVRGTFKPFGFRDDEYNPGDELLVTAGINTRLNPQSGVSFDIAHSIYAADTFAGETIYEAGGKTTISAMYRYVVRFDELRLGAVYRTRATNSSIVGGELVAEALRSIPNQINLRASYKKRFNPGLQITGIAEARLFDEAHLNETLVIEKRSMFDLGVEPSIKISSQASVVGRFIYTLGDITGIEAGVGVAVAL